MKKKNAGVTLIEVIISLAIISIVIVMGSSLFTFGTRTFGQGGMQSDIQFDVRMVSDFITAEVRNATSLEVINVGDIPNTADSYHYIFLEAETIKHRSPGEIDKRNKTGPIIKNTSDFAFELKRLNNSYLLYCQIIGTKGNQRYELDTEVLLNNINSGTINVGKAIRYQKP